VYGKSLGQILVLVVEVEVALIVKFNVAALSHPTLFVKWAVCVPPVVNVKPFQLYGKSLGQILVFVVDVDVALTVKFNVAALSQPTLFVKCAVCEPPVVKVNPFQLYGKSLGQILKSVVDVDVALIVKFNVAELSHPTLFVKCAVCEPPVVKVNPFQLYGKSLGQILKSVVDVEVAFIVKFKVAELSHPTVFVKWAVCVPPVVNVKPFQLYGKSLGQIDVLVVDVDVALTVKFNVAELSHPTAFEV
jgi:surfactin synthase thioesterase subunit